MREQRLKEIEKYISEREMCHLDHLCDVFQVSKITIRRDIDTLCKDNIVTKVYGGVRYNKKELAPLLPYMQRKLKNEEAKIKIGRLAAECIPASATIFLDSGTTTPKVLDHIGDKKINILTNNLTVIIDSLEHANISLLSTGGELNPLTNSFVGDLAKEAINLYNTDIAFLATTGFTVNNGFTNSDYTETTIKQSALKRGSKTYILMDSSKWHIVSLMNFATAQEITGIITDKKPQAELMKYFEKMNVEVIFE